SRLIVDTARPSSVAIDRNDFPSRSRSAITSRSDRDKHLPDDGEKARATPTQCGGFNWSSQHLGRFRRGVWPVGGGPVDGGGGFLGRQCRRGVVQRRPQARNVGGKGFEAVGEYPACPPGGV